MCRPMAQTATGLRHCITCTAEVLNHLVYTAADVAHQHPLVQQQGAGEACGAKLPYRRHCITLKLLNDKTEGGKRSWQATRKCDTQGGRPRKARRCQLWTKPPSPAEALKGVLPDTTSFCRTPSEAFKQQTCRWRSVQCSAQWPCSHAPLLAPRSRSLWLPASRAP